MAEGTNGNGVRDSVLIFRRFLKNPRTIGAVTPSGRVLAQAMVANLPERTPARVVELGPGTGAFTGAIVDRVGTAGRFLAVDIEPEFVREIHQRFPRVGCVQASAEQLESLVKARNIAPVDHILSGLPFASLPQEMTARILDGIASRDANDFLPGNGQHREAEIHDDLVRLFRENPSGDRRFVPELQRLACDAIREAGHQCRCQDGGEPFLHGRTIEAPRIMSNDE